MILEFYGKECPHCQAMKPLVERLKKEKSVEVESYETWHNDENAKKFEDVSAGKCPGVPFFLNKETGAYVCGEAPYEDLEKLL